MTTPNNALPQGSAPTQEGALPHEELPLSTPPEGNGPAPAQPGPQAPASYEDVRFPPGAQDPQGLLNEFKQLAQTLNLPPQAAQQLVEWEFSRAQNLSRHQEAQHQQLLQNWADASKEMLGPSYEEDLALAVRAAETFGGEPLRQLLEETGLGNHPVIVKTFCQIGRATAEDSSLGGKEASGGDKTFAEALYGSN